MFKAFRKQNKKIRELKRLLDQHNKILIGAGAGLSTAAGLTYDGPRFDALFKDYINRYHFTDMYSAGFYPFSTLEEKWAYWARQIWFNRYQVPPSTLYQDILELVKEKDYFVITTNVDDQFQMAGFDMERYFETQGNYGEFQCSVPCQPFVYQNKDMVQSMMKATIDCRIPTALIPTCPNCHEPLTTHLRADDTFVQDDHWYQMAERYSNFIKSLEHEPVLLLEFGVGFNTPTIIRFPFEQLSNLPGSRLVRFNPTDTKSFMEMKREPLLFTENIEEVINQL